MHYDDALAVFAATNRLVDHDESGAVIRVGDEERLLTPAQIMSSAQVIIHADPQLRQVYSAAQDNVAADTDPVSVTSHEIGRDNEQAPLDPEMTGPVSITVSSECYEPEDFCTECCGPIYDNGRCLCDARADEAEAIEQERLDTIQAAVEATEHEEGLDSVFAAREAGDDTPPGVTHPDVAVESLLQSLAERPCPDCGALDCEGECKCLVCGTVLSFGECPGCNPPQECRNCGTYFTPDDETEDLCYICEATSIIGYDNIASDDNESNQSQVGSIGGGQMSNQNQHICTDGRYHFSASDGFCVLCRPAESDSNAISLFSVMDDIGGEEALRESINLIIEARMQGRPGNSVTNRLTRPMLELVQGDASLLAEYREWLHSQYHIELTESVELDDQGNEHTSYYHDYTYYQPPMRATQPVIPGLVDVMNTPVGRLNPDMVRTYRWRAAAEERRAARIAARDAVRVTKNIKMVWVSKDDPTDNGFKIIGPNDEEHRGQAAEWQAAGVARGYRVTFELV